MTNEHGTDRDVEKEVDPVKVDDSSQELTTPPVVDWNGPDDPQNPQNWSHFIRTGHVVLVGIMTLFVNLASTAFAPGAAQLMRHFHQTSSTIATLTVSIYVLGLAIGPLVVAPLSELYGRLILYHVCNFLFLVFTIACAVSTNVGMFLAFRFLCGCAGSAPLTLGGGSIADIMPQEKRGTAMAVFAVGPLLGPVIGPIMGGFIAQAIGWRWIFWVLAIFSGAVSTFAFLFMRETYSAVLLNRKAARLRKETGNPALVGKFDSGLSPTALFQRSIIRPIKLLVLSPIVLTLSVFCAFVFGLVFLLFTTFPLVFEQQYGFSANISGLAYLGLGIGMISGIGLFSVLSDAMLKKQARGGTMKPEYRLPFMMYLTPMIPIGFFWYGWSAKAQTHWIVPIMGTSLIGIGSLSVLIPAQIYLVDAFGPYAASALAANTVLRCLFGTFLPLAGPSMYAALGLGWGNSVLGFIALAFLPVPWLFYKYGEQIRRRWAVEL